MKRFLFLLLIASSTSFAQKKLKTVEVSDTIISASVDRPGDLYIVTKSGQFQKFDADGKLIVLFKNTTAPTLFDPRDGSRLFAYYRGVQHYDFLNPSFNITASYRIDSAFVIQPWLMCPSGDLKLWVLDGADHSLKKINPRESEVEVEVIIDSTVINDATHFTKMREYQNFVFLLDPQRGIYIFNSLGKYLRTIPAKGVHQFHFLGQELYFTSGNSVKFFDLFTTDTREISLDGIKGEYVLTDQRLFAVGPHSIDIYEYTP